MPRALVLCTCSRCAQETWTDTLGDIQNGARIPPSTRTEHRRRDLANTQHEAWLQEEIVRQGLFPEPVDDPPETPPPNIGPG